MRIACGRPGSFCKNSTNKFQSNPIQNPYENFWFGGIEYDDYYFDWHFDNDKENEKIYVLQTQPAAAVFYEDEHYLVTYGLKVLKLPFTGIIVDMNFQLHNIMHKKIEFHEGGVTSAYKNRLYFCQLVIEGDVCYSTPFKKNENIIRNKGMTRL